MSLAMDNFHLNVTAYGEKALSLALEIALMAKCHASHWCDHPKKGLILFWSQPTEAVRYVDADEYLEDLPKLTQWHPDPKPGHRIYVQRKGGYSGKSYIWAASQDNGGDPQSWGWREMPDVCLTIPVHPFPFKMKKASDLAKWVQGWLDDLPEERYGEPPDHDGSNSKGFRIYNEAWGRVDGCGSYSFIAVQPDWAWHGK